MQEIDAKHFHLIAGAGNFADNRGSNGRVNNNGGNKNGGGSSNQGFYGKHTSPDCVNGVITGSLGRPWRPGGGRAQRRLLQGRQQRRRQRRHGERRQQKQRQQLQ
ncbi:Uncharacterised protein [Serratia marcescens]|uniref:Uncharacterized protein n=1 Tax=Serratia marcescens TaxID=615 RepID=A0A380A0Y4_SERMA|nr:Uncharacterised protein [Serratia marcescens]